MYHVIVQDLTKLIRVCTGDDTLIQNTEASILLASNIARTQIKRIYLYHLHHLHDMVLSRVLRSWSAYLAVLP